MNIIKYCECGCGAVVKWPGARVIRGHWGLLPGNKHLFQTVTPCLPGCQCGRHTSKSNIPCPLGCTCKKHVHTTTKETAMKIGATQRGRPLSVAHRDALKLAWLDPIKRASRLNKKRATCIDRFGHSWGPCVMFATIPEKMVEEELVRMNYLVLPFNRMCRANPDTDRFCISQCPVRQVMVDWYFPVLKLCLFEDGCYWHGCLEHCPEEAGRQVNDIATDQKLRGSGYRVSRIWEHDVRSRNFSCLDFLR